MKELSTDARGEVIGSPALVSNFRHPVVATVLFGLGMFTLGTLIYFLISPSPARWDPTFSVLQTIITTFFFWRFVFAPSAKSLAKA